MVAVLRHSESDHSGAAQAASGRRVYDTANAVWKVKIFPGEYYVTSNPDEMLVTVLGSCVSACIRNPRTGIGGMNHFMLPQHHAGGWGGDQQSTRFGNFAMEKLINELIKAGCAREELEVKVFGGGNVTDASNPIGTSNAEFVMRYLREEGLKCAARDLGGRQPRRIHYSPASGKVIRRLLGGSDSSIIVREEGEYARSLSSQKTSGEVELFD